jgi:GT2 family glycosyltransferase
MEVTILVPTYFGPPLVTNCINSIMQQVANPRLLVFKNDIGWLKACNELMSSVTTDVILLNDDTVLLNDIVQELKSLAYSDPSIGIVGGKSVFPDGQHVNNYGIYVGPDGNTAHKHYGSLREAVTEVETQKAVEGSCMFIKREVIDKIGLFDEGFGLGYREEIDFCFRAKEAGYKIVSQPTAEYIHLVSQTSSRLNIHNDKFEYFQSKWGDKLATGKI